MLHSNLNEMEIPKTKSVIPKGFELGTTLSLPIRSILSSFIKLLLGYISWLSSLAHVQKRCHCFCRLRWLLHLLHL